MDQSGGLCLIPHYVPEVSMHLKTTRRHFLPYSESKSIPVPEGLLFTIGDLMKADRNAGCVKIGNHGIHYH